MEFAKIVEILKLEGYNSEFVYNDSEIKETFNHPEGSYHFLVKEGDNWRLGYVNMERGKNEDKTIRIYSSKEDGSNGFILDRLSSYYLFSHVSRAEKNTKIIELLIAKKLVLDDLLNALNQCNIPISYLSTQNINKHSIRMFEENGSWVLEYIDINGISRKRSIPLSLHECIAFVFERIMYLFLLDSATEKYLDGKKSYDYFTPEELATYAI